MILIWGIKFEPITYNVLKQEKEVTSGYIPLVEPITYNVLKQKIY